MASRADGPDDDAVEPAAGAPDPTPPEPTDDERWAAIVAELGDLEGPHADDTPGPDHDDPEGSRPTPGHAVTYPVAPWVSDPRTAHPDTGTTGGRELSGRDWDGTSQIDDAETDADGHEHFTPPDPGPVLGGDPLLTMAWFAVVLMPLFLLVVLIAWRTAPFALVEAAGIVLFLGVGALLWRMPHRRDDSDDDTGAQV